MGIKTDLKNEMWTVIKNRLIYMGLIMLGTYGSYAQSLEKDFCFSIEKRDYNYYNTCIAKYVADSGGAGNYTIETKSGTWKVTVKDKGTEQEKVYEVIFSLQAGEEPSANLCVEIFYPEWNKNNYVLLPGAAYSGNRFQSRRIAYSPKLLDPKDIGVDKPIIISDVPRLNIGDGPSEIQERSGAMAIPSVGFWDGIHKKSVILLTTQENECGDLGIGIRENRTRTEAVLALRSPVIREGYRLGTNASVDKPRNFKEGDRVKFTFKIISKEANRLQNLFTEYFRIRQDSLLVKQDRPIYPYSYCYDVMEEKFNTQNYVKEWGYYSVGMRENYFQDWQIGWTGGMITTYPLLYGGKEETVNHVINNFNWLFKSGIAPSGLFWDAGEKGNIWYGGDIRKPHTKNWHLIRKSGDALFFIMKQFDLFGKKGIPIRKEWEEGARGVAQAFLKIWYDYHQFGQFVDNVTGKIVVGGSTSGAIIPGALALAAGYYQDTAYMKVAKEGAEYYYQNYISKGITCGGPGDALQNPDSESAYAMLESLVTLYETTQEEKWLNYAEEMAEQYATWVFGYDYKFPENSTFGALDMRTCGSVLANTQNKHSAPGICTHSGAALFRLYRMTGNKSYLDLLRSTAFNLPQYMSMKQRPISGMPDGWMNERVNTTDWEGAAKIGEIFKGSTWAETSLLLTTVEIPGIYVDVQKKMAMNFDHLEVRFVKEKQDGCMVEVYNPTDYDANFSYFIDHAEKKLLPLNYLYGKEKIMLKSKNRKTFYLKYDNNDW